MSDIHLLPYQDDDLDRDFARVIDDLIEAADMSYLLCNSREASCDHSEEPDVVCCGHDYILRATFGPVIISLGNGSLRDIDVAPSVREARNAVSGSVSSLVHLDGWTEILGRYVPPPNDEARKTWAEAQELKKQAKEAMEAAMASMRDPANLRKMGISLLKEAGDLEGAASASAGERIGQYV